MSMFPFPFKRRTCEDKCCDSMGIVVLKVKVLDETFIHFFIDSGALLIDWGDGISTYETFHTYSQGGEYTVRIVGAEINTLDVSRCHVLEIDVNGCEWIEYLNCSGNMLKKLNVSGCRWLMELDCSVNELKELHFSGSANLRVLDCHQNILERLSLEGCENLLCFYGSMNEIRELNLECCRELRCVDIGGNNFETKNLNRFFALLPMRDESDDARIMCDLNRGYGLDCDLELLREKGWNAV